MKRIFPFLLILASACAFAQDSYISALPEDASIDGTEWLWCEDSAFTVDSRCEIADIIAAAGGSNLVFKTIDTPAGSDPVADSSTDTLVITCGTGLTCTGTSGTDTVDFTPSEAGLEGFLDLQDLQGAVTDAQVPNSITIDLAALATALAANGANCSSGSFPLGVDASGAVESCTALSASNAGTATALAANGANCSAGNYPLGVDASGASESCTADDDLPDADEVTEAMLKAVDSPADEECLTYESTVGDFEWQSCGSGSGNSFETINTPSGTDPVADSSTDTLNLTCSGGLTCTGDSSTDTVDLVVGNVATASALAANGTNCSAGNYPLGVDASGNAESCTAAGAGGTTITVEEDNSSVDAAVTNLDFTEPDAVLVTSSPAGEANVAMSKYALLLGRTGGQALYCGKADGDDGFLYANAVDATSAYVALFDDGSNGNAEIHAGGTNAPSVVLSGATGDVALQPTATTDRIVMLRADSSGEIGQILGNGTGIEFEGATDDGSETRISITDPTADRTVTIPNADTVTVQGLTCSGTDKVSAISATTGAITCTADSSAAGGDSITVNSSAATDPDFLNGDIDWTLTGGNSITATVGCTDCVALGSETTGNYAAGDAEAGAATTGDSATAFFSSGQIEAARGGTGDDTSGTTGVPRIASGNWTYDAGISHLAASTSADLRGVLSDETGSGGAAVFATSPTISNPSITGLTASKCLHTDGSGNVVVATADCPAGDSNGGVDAALVYGSTTFNHTSSGSAVALTWDSEARDTNAMHSTSSNTERITVQTAGMYVVSCGFRWDTNVTGTRQTRIIHRNSGGSNLGIIGEQSAVPIASTYSNVTANFEASATDYFYCDAFQSSGDENY